MSVPGYQAPLIPSAFKWRRLHSLTGIFLSGYLFFHLLTNSQAALWLGQDGKGFIEGVNSIHKLPYLWVLEALILGLPFLIHGIWGIKYAKQARYNSIQLPYPRNKAYTWQRITAYLLVIGIIVHVIHMRFIEYPVSTEKGGQEYYMVPVKLDKGIYTLSQRIGVELYDQEQIEKQKTNVVGGAGGEETLHTFMSSIQDLFQKPVEQKIEKPQERVLKQKSLEERQWVLALEKKPIQKGEAIAVAKDFGTAELMMVRETFKSPWMIGLYTLFVLIACYHGFNGVWTFCVSWGIALSQRTQEWFIRLSYGLMALVSFLGLSAVWLTYWINLKR